MGNMFNKARSFNQPLNLNTQNVKNMRGMFYNAESFNQPLNWNVGNVTDMALMFYNAKSFNQHINNWDIGKVKSMNRMFKKATAFNQYLINQKCNKWSFVKTQYLGKCINLPTEIIRHVAEFAFDSWDVTNVDTTNMFMDCLSEEHQI